MLHEFLFAAVAPGIWNMEAPPDDLTVKPGFTKPQSPCLMRSNAHETKCDPMKLQETALVMVIHCKSRATASSRWDVRWTCCRQLMPFMRPWRGKIWRPSSMKVPQCHLGSKSWDHLGDCQMCQVAERIRWCSMANAKKKHFSHCTNLKDCFSLMV